MKYVIQATEGKIDDDIRDKLRSTKKGTKGRPMSKFYHSDSKRILSNAVVITVDKEIKELEELIENGDTRIEKVA